MTRCRRSGSLTSLLAFASGVVLLHCANATGTPRKSGVEPPDGSVSGGGSGAGATHTEDDSGVTLTVPTSGGTTSTLPCVLGTTGDGDHDGYTIEAGDCNDCDANVNAGAFDTPSNLIDEDCDGTADNESVDCDEKLDIGGDDAVQAAKSLGICQMQQGNSWGLVNARWTYPDGSLLSTLTRPKECGERLKENLPPPALARGILPQFGPNVKPRQGQSLVALSTGIAREGTNDYLFGVIPKSSPAQGYHCVNGPTPEGFPIDSPSCPGRVTAQDHDARDSIALELTIRAPSNAHALSFDFDFYTYEFPEYVCAQFNDFFVALLESKHPSTPANRNISFDAKGNPVSVNNVFIEVCSKEHRLNDGRFACAYDTKELEGTGFDGANPNLTHGATSWLRTSAPVLPGETIVLRFAVWDMSDPNLDSTVLLDNFRWLAIDGTPKPITERPPR